MAYDFSPEHEQPRLNAVRYDLSAEELQARTTELLEKMPPVPGHRFVCYALNDPGEENAARTVERTVFEASFKNDSDEMARIYGPYESASRFFLSVDQQTQQPVGALRVIENSPAGLMTLNVLPPEATEKSNSEILQYHQISSLDDCWDVGTVAVLPEYRRQGNKTSVQLYRALYVSAMKEGIDHMLSIIDRKPYETMKKYLGIPFEPLADSQSFFFEGSHESFAVYGHIPDFYPKMRRQSLTRRGILARKALWPLVFGTNDKALTLDDTYKN